MYFLVADRFDDGDPGNNDQGAGEFDPSSPDKYNGGDLQGVIRRLDYIRNLGASAVWITPPVANQWWDPSRRSTGYHGYWAENFLAVDRHLGELADYRQLSRQLHARGMYLVQDIVLNHTGNFFAYQGDWNPADPAHNFSLVAAPNQPKAPSQWPFNMNDARDAGQRQAAIYHWTPDVADYTNRRQELDFQMSGLDDLNTENPVVRRALRRSYAHWIRAAGVDAFRLDTAFFVPRDFLDDFLHSRDRRDPGIASVARETGRRRFLVFGEGFVIDKAYTDTGSRKIEDYMTGGDGSRLLPGMLNFPLYGAIGDAFARGRPTSELADRIRRMMKLHRRPHLMPSFVDNHDVDRFLTGGSVEGLKQALLLIMTLPGIPTIYYGTEQGFTEPRAAMFKAGYASGGRDRFDPEAPLYRYLQRIIALRREHKVFSRGTPTVLKENPAGPGALAYLTRHGGAAAIVAINTAASEALLDNLATGLPPGTRLHGLFGIADAPADLVVGAGGRLSFKLPGRGGMVWQAEDAPARPPRPSGRLELAPLATDRYAGDFGVAGNAVGIGQFKLVVDGDLARAQSVTADAQGRWQGMIDTAGMTDPAVRHSLVAWAEAAPGAAPVLSESRSFQVGRPWTLLADVSDPAGDDAGPQGRYRYPSEAGYAAIRPMDIRRVRVWGSGGAMKVDLTMNGISTLWNPQNGFDHVAFTLFFQVPGQGAGATAMPLQNGSLPAGMQWHYRLRAHGWSSALFSAAGAGAEREGTPVTPSAEIGVDKTANTVSFTLPAAALGGLKSLAGVQLYINTWDYDGGYRPLTAEGQDYTFGGGSGSLDVKVMDDTPVITLPITLP